MRQKIYNVLHKIYGILMTISFFAGVLPIIPFIIALGIGGATAEAIATFLYNDYYKWVILGASISVLVGLLSMYLSGESGLSIKSIDKNKKDK